MELRHLRYFVTVVQEMHFGRAAEKLHMVQPALSMQIKDLEEEVGTPLLRRTTRRIELTEAGALFYEEALRTLNQAGRALKLARRAGRGQIGSLRVGYAGNAVLSGIMPNLLDRYRQACPDVALDLQELPLTTQAKEALLEDRMDVCFAPSFQQPTPPTLRAHSLAAWPWVIGMNETHHLAQHGMLAVKLLQDEEFVLYTDASNEGHPLLLTRLLGRPPKISYRSANAFTVVALAVAGYALAMLPGSYLDINIPGLVCRRVKDFRAQSDITLYYRAREDRPVVRAFLELATPEQT